tara:strand:- start:2208 stop:2714 length:507 start_codon:yes stop_codon:yes gene_type:complete
MTSARRAVAIDPGTKNLGFAIFDPDGGRIVACGCSRSDGARPMDHGQAIHLATILPIESAHVESMRWRPRDARSQPNDLLDVQTVGLLAAHYSGAWRIETLEPQEWKRTLPKAIHHTRLVAALEPGETEILERAVDAAGANGKEVLDAVGIALYVSGRIDAAGRTMKK